MFSATSKTFAQDREYQNVQTEILVCCISELLIYGAESSVRRRPFEEGVHSSLEAERAFRLLSWGKLLFVSVKVMLP